VGWGNRRALTSARRAEVGGPPKEGPAEICPTNSPLSRSFSLSLHFSLSFSLP
jgi:hypothetical protein